MDFEVQVKLAIYRQFAETGAGPSPGDVATRVGSDAESVLATYDSLCAKRVLVLEDDRMTSPFSGVPTQHVVESDGTRYHATCAWDALGIPAALRRPGTVLSRCAASREPLRMNVGIDGPGPSDWIFHRLVPAAHWWDDIVYT